MPETWPIPVHNSNRLAGVFVRRQREMAVLNLALVDAQTGQATLVMLAEEP